MILTQWKKTMPIFHDYFISQWVGLKINNIWKDSKFSNWQIFHTPAGYIQ